MEKQNLNVKKVENRQSVIKDKNHNIKAEQETFKEKTEIKTIDVNKLIDSLDKEIVSQVDNSNAVNANPTNQYVINDISGQLVGVTSKVLQELDISQLVTPVSQNMSENSILEIKIEALGLDVSSIESYLSKDVKSLSRDEIFEIFEKLRAQFRNIVGQKLYQAGLKVGVDFNWNFVDDVLNRIFSQWEYSNNQIGGENYKVDFKFTKVIDLLQTIKNRVNLSVMNTIYGSDNISDSKLILEGNFKQNYKTLMYNLIYTDDRYLSDEEKFLKSEILNIDNIAPSTDIFSDEAIEQLNVYSDLFKNFLKSKFGYSDEYADKLLNYIKNDLLDSARKFLKKHKNETITIQEFIKTFLTDSFKSLDISELKFDDLNSFEDTVDSHSFYSSICSKSSLPLKFIKNSFDEIFRQKNLDTNERLAFINLVFKNISLKLGIEVKRNPNGDIILSQDDLKKLNSQFGNCDFTWINEMYQIMQDEAAKISSNVDRNAATIDVDVFLADCESMDAEYINEHFDEMLLSNDGGVRKFAQMIQDASTKFDCTYTERNQLIETIIKFLCNKVNINDFNSKELSIDTINKLNEKNIFYEIESIIDSQELYIAYMVSGNGNIEPSSQGSVGDCWLLSAINALASTEAGQNLFRNQIHWADDYSGVTIYFAGIDQYVTLCAEEIVEAIEEKGLSAGDHDVLIIELAMQKIIGDINSDWPKTFWSMFIADATVKSNYNSIMNWLNELLNNKLADKNFAASFSLNALDSSATSCLCVDGTTFNYMKGPHAFAITNITSTTVTFTNPWDSSIEYTVSWSEFLKLDIYGIETVYY